MSGIEGEQEDKQNSSKDHFETVIITSMIAKQEVIVQCLDGEVAKGFIHPLIDPEGFSVGEHHANHFQLYYDDHILILSRNNKKPTNYNLLVFYYLQKYFIITLPNLFFSL